MATNLLLPEKSIAGVSEIERFEVLFRWLKNLPSAISKADKVELKKNQTSLKTELVNLLCSACPSALRLPLAESFVALFSAGDFSGILDTVNKCADIVKSKDDSHASKMTALQCLEMIFRTHGRMAGSCFLEVVQILMKAWKAVEFRSTILNCLESIIYGLGSSSSSVHKDIYKIIKQGLTDKKLTVRVSAAKCALELAKNSLLLHTNEFESMTQCCFKAFEGSSYNVRCSVSLLLGNILAMTQKPLESHVKGKQVKMPTLDDCLVILSNGFTKGAGGFLKAGGPEILKGGSMASREVRIGVSQAYVFFLAEMGGVWLERHLQLMLTHLLDLLCNPKTIPTHVDAVYSRKCVGFIIQYSFVRLLSESSQLSACNYICRLILKYCTGNTQNHTQSLNTGAEDDSSKATDSSSSSVHVYIHSLVCGLHLLSKLILLLDTAAHPLLVTTDNGIVGGDNPAPLIRVMNTVLLHHSLAVRLSAAGTLYCVGSALPSLITPTVEYLMKGLQINRGSSEGVIGFSNGLSALLSSSQFTELGIPSSKALEIFKYGEEMVRTQFDGGKLSLSIIQSGWALIGAYLSLGPSYVRVNLRSIISLWHSVFPHNHQALVAEMKSGSLPSWKHTLESRNGALTSIVVFTSLCKSLLSAEMCKRIMLPLDSCLAMTAGLLELTKAHGIQLKAPSAMLRLRLYQAFNNLPPHSYEGCLNTLLKEVVAEFTLADNLASTTTSLLRSLCHADDSILLGSWLEETDHKSVEEMLQPNSAAGSGALEHDPASSYLYANKGGTPTEPLPLGVAVIDAAIVLFGRLFHQLSSKHHKQLLTHFKECIKQAKPANRQQAVQINIFTGFLAGLKGLVETKGSLTNNDDISMAYSLISEALCSSDLMLRCAGSEAIGRLSQVVGEPGFVGQVVQMTVDAIKSAGTKDIGARSGYILSLGCLHRYVGGMGSGQHLQLSVHTLQQLATDINSSALGQVWALHALTLIADSGGPLFRNHVDSTLTLLLTMLINTPIINTQMYRCLGNCLSALVTTLGPELQMNSKSMNHLRDRCLICCYVVQCHPDPVVKSSAINCLQQLQLFAPSFVNLRSEVPLLCDNLNSSHLLLRRSAANCLRQFSQQEPQQVYKISSAAGEADREHTSNTVDFCGNVRGMEKIILSKLDVETDEKLRFDLKEVLFSLLSSLAPLDPMKWLLVCNGVLSSSSEGKTPPTNQPEELPTGGDEDDEMSAKFTSGEEKQVHTNINPRWATKVFAVECSRKIYSVCKSDPAHFDLTLAQQKQSKTGGDYLVMHLSELVKTSFIAATASVDKLKLEGYKALQDVIRLFAGTVDPDFPGHVLLEQYQAQIGAALRPAFSADSVPHVTAIACQVCGEWLGSGVSRDIADLKRVQQLLVSSLDKLHDLGSSSSMYGDAVATLESLAVLKAWAELYIKLSQDNFTQTNELIGPHLPILSKYWVLAIQDFAYLSLPSKFNSQLPSAGGTFYNQLIFHLVKQYYDTNWSSLLHAAAISISREHGRDSNTTESEIAMTPAFASMIPINMGVVSAPNDERHNTFHVLMGVAVQALCNSDTFDSIHDVNCCLNAINEIINCQISRKVLLCEEDLVIELLELLHRIMLASSSDVTMLLTLEIAKNLAVALASLHDRNYKISKALLVVAAYFPFKYIPELSDQQPSLHGSTAPVREQLVSTSLTLLPLVVPLHPSPNEVLPTLFYIIIKSLPFIGQSNFSTGSQSFKTVCSLVPSSENSSAVLHSALVSILMYSSSTADSSTQQPISKQHKLLLTSVILMSESCHVPGNSLIEKWCEFTLSCLNDSSNLKLQLTTLQVAEMLFQSPKNDLRVTCIHKLAPEIFMFIQKWSRLCKTNDNQADVIVKATGILEGLLKTTPSEKQADMLSVILHLFISLLITSPSDSSHSSDHVTVHTHILKSLINIGPQYPHAFRKIMSTFPELKVRLETAIKSSKNKPVSKASSVSKPQQPSIKLKVDFSNFK